MKTNRISRRKFLIKLKETVGEAEEGMTTSEKIINNAMEYVKENMTAGELGGLCINELKAEKIVSRKDGVTYLEGKDSLDQDFYLFFDDFSTLTGTMTLPDFEIVGGPVGNMIKGEPRLNPDAVNDMKKQPIESLMKKIVKRMGIVPKNYTEAAEKWIKQYCSGCFDCRVVGLKEYKGYSYLHYRFRREEGDPECDGLCYENVDGSICLEDYDIPTPGCFEPGEDEVEYVEGVEDAVRAVLGKEEEKEGPELATNSLRNMETNRLIGFRDTLLHFDVAEAATLLAVVEKEIEERRKEMAKIDTEQYKDTYWKMGNSYYIKIYEFPDLLGSAKAEVIVKDENTVVGPKPKNMDLTVEKDGTILGLTRITKEEYEKLSSIFE